MSIEQSVEWEVAEKSAPVPLCEPQILHSLTFNRTGVTTVRIKRQALWTMPWLRYIRICTICNYSELYVAALNLINVCLEDIENDIQELKMKQWRQREIIGKNGHFVIKKTVYLEEYVIILRSSRQFPGISLVGKSLSYSTFYVLKLRLR
jgi:hypothetical protein